MVSYHIALGCLIIIKLGKIFKPGHIYIYREEHIDPALKT